MPIEVDEILTAYGPKDYSVRLVNGVCTVVPFAPVLEEYGSMVEALSKLAPDSKKDVLERAVQISHSKEVQRALWMVRSMDTADSGISAFSGVASAVKMYQAKSGKERLDALETDTQQAVDAVLKALGIAFVIHHLYEGGPLEKVRAFRESNAGQAIVFYYAAIEVGLPFTDNALLGGGQMLKSLFDKYGPDQREKLAAVATPSEADAAIATMDQLMGPMEKMVTMASSHLAPIAEAATKHIPTALNVGDKVAGVAATGADVLQVYRYLGARLVAEACIAKAVAEQADKKAELLTSSPANVEIQYTRSSQDLPAPPPKKSGCFLRFWVLLLSVGAAGSLGPFLAALLVWLR